MPLAVLRAPPLLRSTMKNTNTIANTTTSAPIATATEPLRALLAATTVVVADAKLIIVFIPSHRASAQRGRVSKRSSTLPSRRASPGWSSTS
jgi:hypothetical protein